MTETILVVEDEIDMRMLLKRMLTPEFGNGVDTVASGEEAMALMAQNNYDLMLVDIQMSGMDGLQLLDLIKRHDPEQTVVMMTAYGSVDMAVQAMKNGAYDFIAKPFDQDALLVRLQKAMERSCLKKENVRLQNECRHSYGLKGLVGKSTQMQRVYEKIKMVAKTDLTVLITGESGTGKDVTARAIHALSPRQNKPFVAVNCPTVPEHILESELFGYRKGAFTHATQNKIGLFQEADGGSIFLDEIGDITPTIQTKLLRVLQEKEIKPLGDTKSQRVDVRIIASTNRDLRQKINDGQFREDFFYRLNVLPIELPALRAHTDDIALIADHLLKKHCRKLKQPLKRLAPDLLDRFCRHYWEGNVRELENAIMRGILFSSGAHISIQDVGLADTGNRPAAPETEPTDQLVYKDAKEMVLKQFNTRYIHHWLAAHNGNVTQAAKSCGLERQALQQIMRRYHITADAFRQSSDAA